MKVSQYRSQLYDPLLHSRDTDCFTCDEPSLQQIEDLDAETEELRGPWDLHLRQEQWLIEQ